MSASAVVVIVVVVVLAVAAGVLLVGLARRGRLRSRFGSEYDRVLRAAENRRAAEHELAQREQRHAQLQLRPLSDQARQAFEADWARVQEHFVDAPADSVADADRLITDVLAEIGYPTEGFERQAADLSVRHAGVVTPYRRAHDVLVSGTSNSTVDGGLPTDDLRHALLDYRAVFDSLVGRAHATTSHA